MKIAILHHQYSDKYERKSIKKLKTIAKKLNCEFDIFITDSFSIVSESYSNSIKKIKCSNENREFSGWDLSFFNLQKDIYDIVIFSNDTIIKNRNISSNLIRLFVDGVNLIYKNNYPCLLGDLDRIRSTPPFFNDQKNDQYISTYLFALNRNGINIIDKISYHEEIKVIFSNEINTLSVLKKEYRNNKYFKFIEEWLYLPNNGYKWYKHEPLKESNYILMKDKFKCVINENYISQVFLDKHGYLIDFKKNEKLSTFWKLWK